MLKVRRPPRPPRPPRTLLTSACAQDWNALFADGFESLSGLRGEFAEAFGSSYDVVDPSLVSLLEAVEAGGQTQANVEARKAICSTSAFASAMTLDMVR
jgi:hypothetical protein